MANTNLKRLQDARKAVEAYEKELKDLDMQIKALDKSSRDYYTTLYKLQELRKNSQRQLDSGTAKLKKLAASTKQAAKEGKKFKADMTSVNKELKKTDTLLGSVSRGSKRMGSSFTNRLKTLTQYFGAWQLINLAINTFNEVLLGAIRRSIEFEQALANIRAIAGATSEDVVILGKAALEAAGATRFTAIEISKLQLELSKLGFSARETADATLTIARTAQALDAPLATTAERIGQIRKAFNLTIEETVRIADNLVSTINNSALTLDSFATAFQYIGPVAQNANISLEQTSAAMALLADRGFTASRIGTGLRSAFLEIQKTGRPVVDVLREMADGLAINSESMDDFSEESLKASEIIDIFGKRAASQVFVLLQNVEVLEELEDAYYDIGRALKASSDQISTSQGLWEQAKSAYATFSIQLGDTIAQTNLWKEAMYELIGLFDDSAESSARAYEIISMNTGEEVSENLEEIVKGVKSVGEAAEDAFANANGVLTDLDGNTVGYSKTLTKLLDQEGLSGYYTKLRKDGQDVSAALEKVFKLLDNGFGYDAEEIINLDDDNVERLKDYALSVDGLNRLFKEEADAQREVIQARLKTQELNELESENIEKLSNGIARYNEIRKAYEKGKATDSELREARSIKDSLESFLDTDIVRINSELERLRGIQEDARTTEQATALNFYENLLQQYWEGYLDPFERSTREAYERVNKVRFDDSAYKREAKIIQDRIKLLRTEFKEASKYAETQEERQDLEIKYLQDVQKEQQNLRDESSKYADALSSFIADNEAYKASLVKNGDTEGLINLNNEIARYEETLKVLQSKSDPDALFKISFGLTKAEFSRELQVLEDFFSRDRNIFDIDFSGEGTKEAKENAKKQFQEYLDGLEEAIDDPKAKEAFRKVREDLTGSFNAQVDEAGYEGIDWNAILTTGLNDAIGETKKALDAFADVELENLKARMEREKDVIRDRFDFESAVLKSRLENDLISQAQYEQELDDLNKERIAKENEVNRKIFEAEKQRDLKKAQSTLAESLAKMLVQLVATYGDPVTVGIMSAISGSIAAGAYAAEVSAINSREFVPVQFEQGGLINGPSHKQGGVMAGVKGGLPVELEGGEFIVNKRATELNRSLLEAVNSQQGSLAVSTGGRTAKNPIDMQIKLLEEIALATNATYVETSKPKKSYITSRDIKESGVRGKIELDNKRL